MHCYMDCYVTFIGIPIITAAIDIATDEYDCVTDYIVCADDLCW